MYKCSRSISLMTTAFTQTMIAQIVHSVLLIVMVNEPHSNEMLDFEIQVHENNAFQQKITKFEAHIYKPKFISSTYLYYFFF